MNTTPNYGLPLLTGTDNAKQVLETFTELMWDDPNSGMSKIDAAISSLKPAVVNTSLLASGWEYPRSFDMGMDKLTDPASLPTGAGRGCSFSPDGTYLAVTHFDAPFIVIYKRSEDTFTKLDDLIGLPSDIDLVTSCSFSPDGTYLAVGFDAFPYITIYKRSGDIFTKLDDPASLPTGSGFSCSFSPDGSYLAVTYNKSPFITIYKRSGDAFTKF